MLRQDVIPGFDQPGMARELRPAVEVPLRVPRVVAVVHALRVERQPRLARLREMRQQRFPPRREMDVDRIEDRIVGQQERSVGPLQLEPDLLPDLHHHRALRERLVERLRGARAVVRLVTRRQVEGRGEREDVRMLLHERGVEAVHELEMPVRGRNAHVDHPQVDPPQHRVDDGQVFVDVGVHVDLAHLLETGRRCRRRALRRAQERDRDDREGDEQDAARHRGTS